MQFLEGFSFKCLFIYKFELVCMSYNTLQSRQHKCFWTNIFDYLFYWYQCPTIAYPKSRFFCPSSAINRQRGFLMVFNTWHIVHWFQNMSYCFVIVRNNNIQAKKLFWYCFTGTVLNHVTFFTQKLFVCLKLSIDIPRLVWLCKIYTYRLIITLNFMKFKWAGVIK